MTRRLLKSEIIRGYQSFGKILSNGKSFTVPPIKVFYIINPAESEGFKVGFSVSRGTRRAVDRNRLKRLMREAYRNRRARVASTQNEHRCEAVLLYAGGQGRLQKKQVSSDQIAKAVGQIIEELTRRTVGQ